MTIAKKRSPVVGNGRLVVRDEERRFALTAIGVAQSLRQKTVSISDSRELLFNLATLQEMKARRFNPKLIQMMQWGMELPNVERLVPCELNASLDSIVALANSVLRATSPVPKQRNNTSTRPRGVLLKRKLAAAK
jgi:hypothetical protein